MSENKEEVLEDFKVEKKKTSPVLVSVLPA